MNPGLGVGERGSPTKGVARCLVSLQFPAYPYGVLPRQLMTCCSSFDGASHSGPTDHLDCVAALFASEVFGRYPLGGGQRADDCQDSSDEHGAGQENGCYADSGGDRPVSCQAQVCGGTYDAGHPAK